MRIRLHGTKGDDNLLCSALFVLQKKKFLSENFVLAKIKDLLTSGSVFFKHFKEEPPANKLLIETKALLLLEPFSNSLTELLSLERFPKYT